jgi:hypothetical protein
MINVESKVKVYEKDGKDTAIGDDTALVVRSHWNRDEYVVLDFGDKKWTMLAKDLEAAIRNATNSARL